MSRQGKEARSVSLFPFLAVLICAMGALIFLLVVTTRRIRHQAVLQVQKVVVEEVVEDDYFPPVIFSAEIEEPAPAAPVVVQVEEPEVAPEPEPQVINLAREHEEKLNALRLQRSRKLEALKAQNLKLVRLKNELNQSEDQLKQSEQQILSLNQKDKELNQKMNALQKQKARVAEMLQEELQNLDEKKQSQKTARSKYSIIPYDGQTGTAKRPILIECTDQGLTFLPEGITLTPEDLKEFTPGYNPLLAGTQALFQYWKSKDRGTGKEPYVLILVRPSGSVGYYVARKLLNNLELDSGYELIDADWEFALPDKDSRAEQICQEAVDRVLSERKHLVSQLSQNQQGTGERRLQFDARTGMVRVIEPEEGSSRGRGSAGGSEQLALGRAGSGTSRFSDVLTPRQQMARAEHLSKVADQQHIVPQGRSGHTGGEHPGLYSGATSGGGKAGDKSFANLPGSRPGAEVYSIEDLKGSYHGDDGAGPGVKQAKVIGRDQLKEMAKQHLVELEGAQSRKPAGGEEKQGQSEAQSDSQAAMAQNRVIENPFLKEGTPTGTSTTQQQTASADAIPPSPFPRSPGQSARGAGNASSISLHRSHKSANQSGRDSQNRQWGPPQSRSGIGFEREITIQIGADRIIFADEKVIAVDQGITQEKLSQSMMVVMDQYVASWGPAPKGFYWVPTLQFTVSPGGNQFYERLKSSAQKMGLQTEAKYTLDPLPGSSSLSTVKEQ
ncbi:hypothetical protein [Gimesia algae]|uniref:IncA protein n=1 Tax=Gimesia algae TaxID=2527971 RepID=A0A517VCH1_9PLAN|nr:hypothetical protein [Gimesia algae]QDT90706.1 hypothetical protein Pan161_23590 [Gimesia algae]